MSDVRGLSRGIISLYRINRLPSELCTVQALLIMYSSLYKLPVSSRAGTLRNLCCVCLYYSAVQCSAVGEHYFRRQAGSLWGRRSRVAPHYSYRQWITLQMSNYSILYLFLLSSQEYSSFLQSENIWFLILRRWGKFKSLRGSLEGRAWCGSLTVDTETAFEQYRCSHHSEGVCPS